MLDVTQVWNALSRKTDQFRQSDAISAELMIVYSRALSRIVMLDKQSVMQRLSTIPWPGAWPTDDLDMFLNMVVPFAYRWQNHRQAREWALDILAGITTFAVDGSQILPSKDISWPIGLVQIGWFENPHSGNGRYTKNISVDLLAANDLSGNGSYATSFPDEVVNWRRFQGEIQRLINYMETNAGVRPKPLCFYDGSLVISFAQHMLPRYQQMYVDAVKALLATSLRTQMPLVGFVDTSYANDMVKMLKNVYQIDNEVISDAALLRPQMTWGDRSQIFVCGRDDGIIDKFYNDLCFTYLKTTQNNPPARVEFPRWLYQTGEHEQMLDLIRAECIVGVGYPYVVETADAVAVLTAEDRQKFYALVQQFAAQNEMPLRFSRKAVSKWQRRS